MADLDKLYRIALDNAAAAKGYKRRYAYADLKAQLDLPSEGKKIISILSGLRGTGKTTLMLQLFGECEDAFYFSADSIYARTSSVYAIVEQAIRQGYKTIFIDEIHKYPRWVDELKNIYDDFSIRLMCSGSSTAALKKGSIVLGRRALDATLHPLSLGEYIYLREGERYEASLDAAMDKRRSLAWLSEHPKAEKHYQDYMRLGGFPAALSEKASVYKLVEKMIYEDALAEFSLSEKKIDVMERLLGFLSLSRPGEFSYTSFSSMSGHAKSSVYEAVHLLSDLGLLRVVEEQTPKSKAKMTIKILFSHPNLRTAFAQELMKEAEVGALREEYFLFHMGVLGFPLFIPKGMRKNPDYESILFGKNMLFEVGGPSKSGKQFSGRPGIVMDDEKLIVLGFVQKTDQK